jgi:hypothetical protein
MMIPLSALSIGRWTLGVAFNAQRATLNTQHPIQKKP